MMSDLMPDLLTAPLSGSMERGCRSLRQPLFSHDAIVQIKGAIVQIKRRPGYCFFKGCSIILKE